MARLALGGGHRTALFPPRPAVRQKNVAASRGDLLSLPFLGLAWPVLTGGQPLALLPVGLQQGIWRINPKSHPLRREYPGTGTTPVPSEDGAAATAALNKFSRFEQSACAAGLSGLPGVAVQPVQDRLT